jgi:hypothetical protein
MRKAIRPRRSRKRASGRKAELTAMLRRLEDVYRRRGVTTREKNLIWQTMAALCFYQIESRRGPFYNSAKLMLKTVGAS